MPRAQDALERPTYRVLQPVAVTIANRFSVLIPNCHKRVKL